MTIFNKINILPLIFVGLWAQWGICMPKSAVLDYMNQLKKENQQKLQEIDARMNSSMSKSFSLKIDAQNKKQQVQSQEKLGGIEHDIQGLVKRRNEYLLRQTFIDRLQFQIEYRYRGQNLQAFLKNQLKTMALQEAKSLRSDIRLWKFLTYLGIAISELPEKGENLLEFTEGFLSYSSISNPKPPHEYGRARSYTNGHRSESANTVDKEALGELVEKRLQALRALKATSENQKVFELRTPVIKSVSQVIGQQNSHSLNPAPKTPNATKDATTPSLPQKKAD